MFFSLTHSVCPARTPGSRGGLEVPGHHRHARGAPQREGQDVLQEEESADQADQAGREERREQDREVHGRTETVRCSGLSCPPG